MRYVYTAIFYLLIPVVLLRLWWRSRRSPAYAKRWAERFACFPALEAGTGPVIWVHAVSVGETLAALPMIKAIQAQYTDAQLVVTTMTPTGSDRVREALGDSVFHVYAPYDMPDCVARFLNRVQPQLLIIMETELWPNTINGCHQRGIPVVLANARLSAKSAAGYQRFSALTTPMLQQLSVVAAQHVEDALRFEELGLPQKQCEVIGSIKFDLNIEDELKARAQSLKQEWSLGGQRKILLAASTHQGEDEDVLSAFAQLRKQHPELFLVLVPRHPERFDRVAGLCVNRGYRVQRRSEGQEISPRADVMLGDTMGELLLLLGACDVAFIGGSLVPTGGHNLMEPAAWSLPMLSGPHLFNFAEASRLLVEAGGLVVVNNADELAQSVQTLLSDDAAAKAMGSAAQAVADENRGALGRLLEIIGKQLDVRRKT